MNFLWQKLKEWMRFLRVIEPDSADVRTRIRYMERNVGLPVRAVVITLLAYYLFFSNWIEDVKLGGEIAIDVPPREMVLDLLRRFFLLYVVINVGFASLMLGMRQLPLTWIQRVVFTVGSMDALFLAALMVATGGFDSILYWVSLGLILRNAVSTPDATRQIVLNLLVTICYAFAGIADILINHWEEGLLDPIVLFAIQQGLDTSGEPFVLRLVVLLLMTSCCYGMEVLLDQLRRANQEAREYALRQQQFEATGRLAAEIAHQLKNPLGIINNAAFTLQRTVKEGKAITQQIQMIREEVERSDRIITELMGYARLSEGRIEKVVIAETLDHALDQVFPAAAKYEVQIEREYAPALPPLLMQRGHISEVFMNILINAREAMNGKGQINVTTAFGENYSVVVTIADTGPGIPAEKLAKIFEPYFTTKEKGSGLGLAIVKHNTEIYGGTVEVESELGKGTRFTIKLPARTLMKIRR
jgi:signal transduction histidine kinase